MNRSPYRVFHLNRPVATFNDREEALDYVNRRVEQGMAYGDFEILDASDEA